MVSQSLLLQLGRLGVQPVLQASAKQPWQALKALGNNHERPFQWVTHAELEQHIDAKAMDKKAPMKKGPRSQAKPPRPVSLVPEQVKVPAGAFLDEHGQALGHLDAAGMSPTARGLVIATPEQAFCFLRDDQKISVDALALLTLSPIDVHPNCQLECVNLTWPGLLAATQEPLLIRGTCIQLGDLAVSPKVGDVADSASDGYDAAVHKLRSLDKALHLVRFHGKYGLRCLKKDEGALSEQVYPGKPFVDCGTSLQFEVGPWPYGISKQAIVDFLQTLPWVAKPLKPIRGSHAGRYWLLGSSVEPPAVVASFGGKFLTITKVKDLPVSRPMPNVVASMKTLQKLSSPATASTDQGAGDPWLVDDPWKGYGTAAPVASAPAASSKLEEIETRLATKLSEQLQEQVKGLTDTPWMTLANALNNWRLSKPQVGVLELFMELLPHHVLVPEWRGLGLVLLNFLMFQCGPCVFPGVVMNLPLGPAMSPENFNAATTDHAAFQHWRSLGWIEFQDLAFSRFQVPPQPTCKHSTRPDHIWLSPELQRWVTDVTIHDDIFADHAVLQTHLLVAHDTCWQHTWRSPAVLPWSDVATDDLDFGDQTPFSWTSMDLTSSFQVWSKAAEHEIIQAASQHAHVPQSCYGRGQTVDVTSRPAALVPIVPGRCGDVQPRSSLLSGSVQHLAEYLVCPWFQPNFQVWWAHRDKRLHGSPAAIPSLPPSLEVAKALFLDFELNYRALESWHLLQRTKIVQAKHFHHNKLLFKQLKLQKAGSVSHIKITQEAQVTEIDGNVLDLDSPMDFSSVATWTLNGLEVSVTPLDSPCQVSVVLPDDVDPPTVGCALQAASFLTQFDDALMPGLVRILLSFLLSGVRMGDLATLFGLLESGEDWPIQLVTGFVCPIAKCEGAELPTHFRPIVLLSLLYRIWASASAKSFLPLLVAMMPEHVFGFIPGKRFTDLWSLMQLAIDVAGACSDNLVGYNADLIKCFNRLPRAPLLTLLRHMGLPTSVATAWQHALSSLQRRFRIHSDVGPAHLSETGFPEGDPLSCVATLGFNIVFDCYVRQYAPSCIPWCFVDNLQLLSSVAADLHAGTLVVDAFMEAWDLSLDPQKNFTWATNSRQRALLKAIGHLVRLASKDLGAQMHYSQKPSREVLKQRLESVSHFWTLLRHSSASSWF
eukprot:s1296_g2.t1